MLFMVKSKVVDNIFKKSYDFAISIEKKDFILQKLYGTKFVRETYTIICETFILLDHWYI